MILTYLKIYIFLFFQSKYSKSYTFTIWQTNKVISIAKY